MDEISKFLKFFAFKSTQIIVQSRLGGLIYTKCNTTGTDWVSFSKTSFSFLTLIKSKVNKTKKKIQRKKSMKNLWIWDRENKKSFMRAFPIHDINLITWQNPFRKQLLAPNIKFPFYDFCWQFLVQLNKDTAVLEKCGLVIVSKLIEGLTK